MSDSEEDETKTIKGEAKKGKGSSSSKQPFKPTAAITLQEELLEDILSTLEVIKSAKNLTKVRLQTYQNAVNADLDNANKYNKNIVGNSKIPEEVLQAYLDSKTFKRIKDTYWAITTELTERLEELDINNPPKNQTSKTFDSELRLPSIDLPIFSGDYDDWLNFINMFNSSVHNRSSLEPVQKLWYLGNSVKGEAHNHIKNLAYTDENYSVAREILHEQYNHTRKIAHTYMKKLLDFKSIAHENAKDIREFISKVRECLVSLKTLGLPTDSWDYILLFNLQPKIPHETSVKWEEHLGSSKEIPKFTDFLKFLEDRFRTLEMIEVPAKEAKKTQKALHTKSQSNEASSSLSNQNSKRPSNSKQNIKNNHKHKPPSNNANSSGKRSSKNSTNASCVICKQNHPTYQCNSFRNNPPQIRRQLAKQYKLCFNCLGSSHTIDVCYSTKTCVYCKQQHHSLLHLHEQANSTNAANLQSTSAHQSHQSQPHLGHSSGLQNIQQSSSFYATSDSQPVRILGTALVRISNSSGYSIVVRALLDSGADDNYIISSTVQNVGLRKYSAVTSIVGLNDVNVGSTDYKVNFQIQSMDGIFKFDSSASVVESITSKMPSQYIDPENFGFLNNLQLADPHFNQPGRIQLLLGVGFMVRIKRQGLKRFKDVLAERTLLGWVIMGQCTSDGSHSNFLVRTTLLTKSVSNEELSKQIQKFFEIEEYAEKIPMKPEDALCEKKFIDSVKRCVDGKLSVELPFREDSPPILGTSKHIALRRFLNLEKKLENNPTLKEEYSKTFTEYLNEGHLLPVSQSSPPGQEYFLPHHAVVKESSTTTKVRVVFDGSCKSSDSTSLNDHLLIGQKLQTDIRDVFFNWRKYQFALTADIAKMYRMFWVDEKHRNYQKVLWRFNKDDPISEYCLATVTFGTSSAPFQAIRALHYIAEREGSNYPVASKALLSEFYVDDFISGAHSLTEAVSKQTELREVLSKYGLNIRKWSSNSTKALEGVNEELKETLTELSFEEEEFRKTLGVFWAPKGDYFSFSTSHFQIENNKLTKRTILSLIARLYDPLGWVGPCTLHAKIIMQRIWEQNLNWDDDVCGSIRVDFINFLNDLHQLTKLKIPRWVNIEDNTSPLTLYGFSDASLKAYGAVIYLKNPNVTETNQLILLASRTRVKPLKHITLARLELCAAVMLSELIDWARELLKPHPLTVLAFSDSKIVLSWLKSHPSRWKMYIASRTTKILESTKSDQWSYVNTKCNPADLASRGLIPSDLINNQLWWNGPSLSDLNNNPPSMDLTREDCDIVHSEAKVEKPVLHVLSNKDPIICLLSRYSSHGKMIRVMRYVTDFMVRILKVLKKKHPDKAERYQKVIQSFPPPENQILRQVQKITFAGEIKALQDRKPLPRKSRLHSLHPFIDGFGILRVGGRLENAYMSYNQKHPIILPSHHQVSTNLIHLGHHATFHGPNSLTASFLRYKFHILRMSDRIKVILRGCPKCVRLAKETHEQLMGSLPSSRVNPHRPFLSAGVDYAGPFNLKAYKGRCNKIVKSYVALFVCFCTKAIHLELVMDLRATAFLAAFRRFTSRRGHCQELRSDCGTNFVKGNKLLVDEIYKAQHSWKSELAIDFEEMGTNWSFNPPGAPHFGGLWEAGVKSMKTHLNKTFGNQNFTAEELNTVLVQIEGVLNSRPLCPLSTDPTDFSALTPAHFLIGESIVSPPDRYYDLEAKHPVDRWQFLQKLKQAFWVSWKKEYLHRLNTRPKWKHPGIEYKQNDLVILTDENTPSTYWPMAIITQTHPGKDGITRVVTLKTSKGQSLKRPVSKLRLLAYNPEDFKVPGSVEDPSDPKDI